MTRVVPNTSLADHAPSLTARELEDAVRATDPAAFLIAPRILRRVIKHDAGIGGIGLRVPHRKTYVIDREKLLHIVDRSELDLMPSASLPPTVILIARPSADSLAELSGPEALSKFWRQLFHTRVHLALGATSCRGTARRTADCRTSGLAW